MTTTSPSVVPGGGPRLAWADFLRGAAIICVVYFHTTLFLALVGVDDTLGKAKAVFELIPLPAFFLIAGMFSARAIRLGTFPDLLVGRVVPLLYAYALWSVLRFLEFFLLPALPSRDTDVDARDPLSLALLPVLPTSLYWFLYALALFMVVAFALRRVPRLAVVIGAALVSTLFTSGLVDTHTVAWNRVGALLVFFVAGVFYAKEIRDAVARATIMHLVVAVVVFVAVSAPLTLFRSSARIPFVVLIAQCVAIAAAALASTYLSRAPALAFVSRAGRASLPIYLVHLLVIAPLAWLVGALAWGGPAWLNIAIASVITAVSIAAGFGLGALARRYPWLIAPMRSTPRATTTAPVPQETGASSLPRS